MAKRRKRHQKWAGLAKGSRRRTRQLRCLQEQYETTANLAVHGDPGEARRRYLQLEKAGPNRRLRAIIANDLAALSAVTGDDIAARQGFESALAIDERCDSARRNLTVLMKADEVIEPGETGDHRRPLTPGPDPPDSPEGRGESELLTHDLAPAQRGGEYDSLIGLPSAPKTGRELSPERPVKVAMLSFLFNWPSTGGGIVHTVELAQFLTRAGYDVRHFFARYPPWEIGRTEGAPPFPSEALEFGDADWNMPEIQWRFPEAVDAFRPDHVIVTDSWNSKPLLADAVREYPYILRFQAQECRRSQI